MRKNKSVEQTTKKSRAKYQCPEGLENIIKKINLVPLTIEMRTFESVKGNVSKESISKLRGIFREYFQTLPKDFQMYALGAIQSSIDKFQPEDDSLDSAYKFGLIVGVCEGFYWLRESVVKFIERIDRIKKGEEFDPFSDALNITTSINVIRIGEKFEASLTGFAELIGHFEADRLRICEICNRLFWAKRKESKTCSAKCFNNFRQQLYRKLTAEEKAERKSRRESNRERNKKLKQMRGKKNGTL